MRSQAGGTPLVPVALKEVQRLRLRTCSNELEARGTRRWRSHQLHRTVTSPLGGTEVLQDDDVNDTTKMLLGSLGLLGTVITEYLHSGRSPNTNKNLEAPRRRFLVRLDHTARSMMLVSCSSRNCASCIVFT